MAGRACWLSLTALIACSGGDEPPDRRAPEMSDVLPMLGGDAGPAAFVTFVDESTGFQTLDVYDATREVVRFDAAVGAMVSFDGSAAVSGWTTSGTDLSWSRSGVAFRVRFGSELGERRAF